MKGVILLICYLSAPVTSHVHYFREYNSGPSFMVPVFLLESDHLIFLCNGLILSKRFILTTAQCVYGRDSKELIVFNTTDRIEIDQFIIHEDFDDQLNINDIAIVKLNEQMTFDNPVFRFGCVSYERLNSFNNRFQLVFSWNIINNTLKFKYLSVNRTLEGPKEQFFTSMQRRSKFITCVKTGRLFNTQMGDNGAVLVDKNKQFAGILSYSHPTIATVNCFLKLNMYTNWIRKNAKLSFKRLYNCL